MIAFILAGRPSVRAQQWFAVLALLLTLLRSPQLQQAVQDALSAGPRTCPLGQQLATAVILFLRRLADHGPWLPCLLAWDGRSVEEHCWLRCLCVLATKPLVSHCSSAVTSGPAALQLHRALVGMLGRLRQQLQGSAAVEQLLVHHAAFFTGVSTLGALLYIQLAGLDRLLDVEEGAIVPGQTRQRAPHLCLSASLSCFQAAGAVPDVVAALKHLVMHAHEDATFDFDTNRHARTCGRFLNTLGGLAAEALRCHALLSPLWHSNPRSPGSTLQGIFLTVLSGSGPFLAGSRARRSGWFVRQRQRCAGLRGAACPLPGWPARREQHGSCSC